MDDDREPGLLADLATAVAFFTRLPVPGGHTRLAAAAWAFPCAGAGIGLIGGLVYALGHALGLNATPAAVLAVGAMILVTGALHEDGLADAADGLGARGGAAARLAAMRDSHVGTFGVLALVLVTVGRIAAVAGIGEGWLVIGALVGSGAVSRAVLAPIMQAVQPARHDGLAAGAGRPTANGATLAAVLAVAIAVVGTGPMTAIVGLISAGLAAYMVAALARRALGGTTGDVLGAAQQVSDVVFLMAVSAIA